MKFKMKVCVFVRTQHVFIIEVVLSTSIMKIFKHDIIFDDNKVQIKTLWS